MKKIKAAHEIWLRFAIITKNLKKGENGENQYLLFQQCFSKLSFCMVIETQDCSQLVKTNL